MMKGYLAIGSSLVWLSGCGGHAATPSPPSANDQAPAAESPATVTLPPVRDGAWRVTGVASIVDMTEENLDKSGRNPKILLRLELGEVVFDQPAPDGVALAVPFSAQIRRENVQAGFEPGTGLRVKFVADGSGIAPSLLVLRAIGPS